MVQPWGLGEGSILENPFSSNPVHLGPRLGFWSLIRVRKKSNIFSLEKSRQSEEKRINTFVGGDSYKSPAYLICFTTGNIKGWKLKGWG